MQNHHEGCCKHTDVNIQSTNTKAAARVKDITTKAATVSTMQAAAKVKSIATQAVTRNITTNRVRTPPRSRRRWWSSPVHLRH